MTSDPLIARLRSSLGEKAVVTDPDVLDSHRNDHATFCSAGVPRLLVRPSSTSEVQEVLRAAGEHGVPVVTQGARTGLSGAANALDGCLLLSTARLNQILEISVEDQVAVVQPGVVNSELSRAVLDQGLFYPPDPSSWEMSTIGGNIATNAGGLCCVKYGVTGDFVRGLEVVLASGEVVRTGRRTVKGVAGYDLTRLIVGSEGTLGVVTEATLALRPEPEAALTAAATFMSIEDGIAAAAAVMASGLRPSLLEFLDGPTARAIQDYRDMGLPADVGSLLIAQSDRGPRAAEDVAAIAAICESFGAVEVAVASGAEESRMLLEARRLVNPALEPLGVTLVDDVAVPRSKLVALLDGIAAIGTKYDVLICCPGHVGDGNMHPTVVFDRDDAAAEARALEAFGAVMELGLSLGGTITGEHGIGTLKAQWLEQELGPVGLGLQRKIKEVFDPGHLLNPGKVLRPFRA
ncbi:glycolate oxidase [Kribbella orskensis]|uniref:Glycolate oxidase n=1 Tax=Kribbella orskensis TaxID=2512216 RepID=A0ABY2BF18_9ACTN|nr:MULTISPECIES: FAD-linked oxidase C-terminal domain-containing protein [Kribbella]TCN36875.1 glycolate oxidase [Kribbella sp. VKM Ac-2500]TCO18299.1 glycolate oxidase [Kribbella orskensis]